MLINTKVTGAAMVMNFFNLINSKDTLNCSNLLSFK